MKRDTALFALVATAVFAYIVARAIMVPVIHDEARTYQMFVATGEFLPYRAAWDAGNHLLVTALAQISEAIDGSDLFFLRIWSVLGFVLYARYAWCIGRRISSPLVRWCLWLALLCTPFVLDFFSLFRGYGLAMGLLLMALHHFAAFVLDRRTIDLVATITAMTLAAYGSLSMLLIGCATSAGCMAVVLLSPGLPVQRAKRSLVLLLALIPLVFAAWYSSRLSVGGALYFGTRDGLFDGTLLSILHVMLGTMARQIAWGVVALLVFSLVMTVANARAIFTRRPVNLLAICVALLLADLAGRLFLGAGFGVLYPTDRTAMHMVPLFLIAMAVAVDRAAERWPEVRFAALALLLLPARTIATANIDRTVYWSEQAIPEEFYHIALERQRDLDRPLMIGAYHQMPSCWRFTSRAKGWGLNELDPTDFPHVSCDLLMIDPAFKQAPPGFRTIARAATGHNDLLERIEPLPTQVVSDTAFHIGSTDEEFIGLWEPLPAAFVGREAIIEWYAAVTCDRVFEGVIVLEVANAQGGHLLYRKIEIPPTTTGNRTRMGLRLPAITPADGRIAFYIFNPRGQTFTLEDVRIRIHRIIA